MTSLERQMYLALQGARTIVTATANVNPKAYPIKTLVDRAIKQYKQQEAREAPAEEHADAARE